MSEEPESRSAQHTSRSAKMNGGPDTSRDHPDTGREKSAFAAAGSFSTREDGSLDISDSIGGVRGLLEAALPSAAFLIIYLITAALTPAIAAALVVGIVFTALRLLQNGPMIQSISGLVGVVICAIFAYVSGDPRGYYQPGFYVNGAYIVGFVVSILVRWPFFGLVFGALRGEGTSWRDQDWLRRRYALATWLVVAVLVLRLAIQVPLYYTEALTALGVSRILMGLPLYALALWIGWMMTRTPQK